MSPIPVVIGGIILLGLWWLNRQWRRATTAAPLVDEGGDGALEEIVGNLGGCVTLVVALVVLGVVAWVALQ